MQNVCVFASSSEHLDNLFYDVASELGALLGRNGFNIVYGGSRLGLMYACASQVKINGGKIIGVMPERLNNMGCGNPDDCDEFILTKGMRERKATMDELSDAVIALAGGFGTLEELSEMIVQKQLGYNNKPIILLNTSGFYNHLNEFFKDIMRFNFAKPETECLYYIAQTPAQVLDYLLSYESRISVYSGKF